MLVVSVPAANSSAVHTRRSSSKKIMSIISFDVIVHIVLIDVNVGYGKAAIFVIFITSQKHLNINSSNHLY